MESWLRTKCSRVRFAEVILSTGLKPSMSLAEENQKLLRERLGPYGYQSLQLSIRKQGVKRQQYSMSYIAAISQEEVIGTQIIEGAFDATLFEGFMFKVLKHVRSDPKTRLKSLVVLMDNAVIHHHSSVLETCLKLKALVLFNAEYSPWLNPVEQLFGYVKG